MHNQPMKIIDPHVHLIDLQKGDYHWLKKQNPPFWSDKQRINVSVSESDLLLAAPYQLAGFVHIEAGFDNKQPWREIEWLEQTCSLPFKSVACADITHKVFSKHVFTLSQYASVVGIRHILDEQAANILSTPNTLTHIKLLAEHQLSFDAQFNIQDSAAVKALLNLLEDCPQAKIIVNHGGWPLLDSKHTQYTLWLENLMMLSQHPNNSIKLSGWEMLQRTWSKDVIHKVLLDCLLAFGRKRVMLASNFPVCLLSCQHSQLWHTYMQLASIVDADCLHKITYQNAYDWYQFG